MTELVAHDLAIACQLLADIAFDMGMARRRADRIALSDELMQVGREPVLCGRRRIVARSLMVVQGRASKTGVIRQRASFGEPLILAGGERDSWGLPGWRKSDSL
jgi:hypothetical protein